MSIVNGSEIKSDESEESKKLMSYMTQLITNSTKEQKEDAEWVLLMMNFTEVASLCITQSKTLRKDKDFAMSIAESFPEAITLLDKSVWDNKEIMLTAVENGYSMRNMPRELMKDQEILNAYDEYTTDFVKSRNAEKNDNLSRAKLL